jgi:predicted transcriptional regulator
MINQQIAKSTHIQHTSRLSYDKMTSHINQLEQKEMIYRDKQSTGSITLTDKGKMFLKQYKKLLNLVDSAGL